MIMLHNSSTTLVLAVLQFDSASPVGTKRSGFLSRMCSRGGCPLSVLNSFRHASVRRFFSALLTSNAEQAGACLAALLPG